MAKQKRIGSSFVPFFFVFSSTNKKELHFLVVTNEENQITGGKFEANQFVLEQLSAAWIPLPETKEITVTYFLAMLNYIVDNGHNTASLV